MTSELFSLLDVHFANFLANRSRLAGVDKERFHHLVLALSHAMASGHSCLILTPGDVQFLLNIHLVSEGGTCPLVIHNQRLYLHRFYLYETRLAQQIKSLVSVSFSIDSSVLCESIPEGETIEVDWQQEAAKIALTRALTIITGGPGTGKTTTVVKIIAVLLQLVDSELKIALAAPTGKAAMRLRESVANSLATMSLTDRIKNRMPCEAMTLHRLLGVRKNSPQFRYNHENPMDWDVVVVDEASMVDLALMSKLVDALKPGARLVLLGDKDQLASVESGAVLVDFIRSLSLNTVELKKTYRFDRGIKQLAEAINRGDGDSAWSFLVNPVPENVLLFNGDLIGYISKRYSEFMQQIVSNKKRDIRRIFQQFNSFQVLCGVHFGRLGVEGINRSVELSLIKRGFDWCHGDWYPGRPVLIRRNDYGLDLYNGDIGICLPDIDTGTFTVWFERADGSLRGYSPYRLPACETVFAMTIHKSQGSEFDEVVVVLPDEDNRILSRELVYTAVTRAKKNVRIVATKTVFDLALSRNIERLSGLSELLRDSFVPVTE